MANFDAPEFDDELLSAYLDDELSAEERARVEERLAADPRARQLLAELRGVSQAMRSLPPEQVGVDLSEAVLRRAERAILAGNEQAASNERMSAGGAGNVAWSMPFGRSKRSWFWASAALAAGLLLMFYERGVNERGDLPNRVALSDRDELREDDLRKREPEALRAPMARMQMRSADGELTEDRFDAKDEALDSVATAEPPATAAAPTPPGADASGPAAGTMVLGRGRESRSLDASEEVGFRAGLAVAGENRAAESPAAQNAAAADMVVVHVNATPAAIQNRMFDAVLIRNDIQPERAAGDAAQNAASNDVDLVLVEATPVQIVGCMDALEKDKGNYLAIEVDEQSVANQRARASENQTEGLSRFNRGLVPPQQKIASNWNFYAQPSAAAVKIAEPSWDKLAAKAPQAQAPSRDSKQLDSLRTGDTVVGEALPTQSDDASSVNRRYADSLSDEPRVTTLDAGGVGGAMQAEGATRSQSAANDFYYGANVQNNARRAVQKLATKADTLQVLFVLTCPTYPATPTSEAEAASEPTSSASAAEPAAEPAVAPPATSPAQEGIED